MSLPPGARRDPATNPAFASWSAIYVPYCSGDDWLGQMDRACDAWAPGSCEGNATAARPVKLHRAERLGAELLQADPAV